jgi:hypothetical protein
MELYDPQLNHHLSHQYDVLLNGWVTAYDLP